jgi:hypothetical protein
LAKKFAKQKECSRLTDEDINRQIAERIFGWRVELRRWRTSAFHDVTDTILFLDDARLNELLVAHPQGGESELTADALASLGAIYPHETWAYLAPGKDRWAFLPDFATDLNAALLAWQQATQGGTSNELTLIWLGDFKLYVCVLGETTGEAESAAKALCLAVLKFGAGSG